MSSGSQQKKQSSLLSFFSKKTPLVDKSDCDKTNHSTSIQSCRKSAAKSSTGHDLENEENSVESVRMEDERSKPEPFSNPPQKRSRVDAEIDDEKKEETPKTQKKRRRILIDSDSEEEDPSFMAEEKTDDSLASRDELDEDDLEDLSKLKEKFGIKGKKTKEGPPTSTPAGKRKKSIGGGGISQLTKSFLTTFQPDDSVSYSSFNMEDSISSAVVSSDKARFDHLSLDFLKPEQIRDANKKLSTDLDYDPRTLYIPDSYYRTVSPGIQQWWKIKAQHFDTILFFKVGKFYEMYHMDAVVCVKELNLTFMKGSYAHCGFPEIAYGRFADQLVQRGYKVARVEQTETPQQMEERKKTTPGSKQKPKVVRREVCQVTTPGTQTFSFMDVDNGKLESDVDSVDSEGSFGSQAHSKYLMALCERPLENETSTYGVCFVDTACGKFQMGQFADDFQRSRLRTLLAHYPPAQLLFERGKVSSGTQSVFRSCLAGQVLKEALTPKTEFWTARKTLEELSSNREYFGGRMMAEKGDVCEETWPKNLLSFLEKGDPMRVTPAKDGELAVMSLGAVIWYLRACLIDVDLISMKNFVLYVPNKQGDEKESEADQSQDEERWWEKQRMVLDGITLRNLDVIPGDDGRDGDPWRGTLLDRMDFCSTAFGKRLLRQWICAPLCDVTEIRNRQDAVRELLSEHPLFVQKATELLRKMPDLERLLQKIHTLGSKHRSETHPDGRAVMFEADKYNKRKIGELLFALSGFRAANELHKRFDAEVRMKSKSTILRECLNSVDGGLFPDIHSDLEELTASFNAEKAKKDGVIVPEPGFVESYDRAVGRVDKLNNELEAYLKEQRKKFGCSAIKYVGTGRNRFQLEIPDSAAKNVSSDYIVSSQRKGFKRYMTQDIEGIFGELQMAEEERETALKDNMRCIFELFDSRYAKWKQTLECLAVFDVLLGFASYAGSLEGEMCLPEFKEIHKTENPFIEIEEGVHPCFAGSLASGSFIPNNTAISIPQSPGSVLLITGPNMGGKSTLMRQVSLIVIVAQLGSYVPAKKCHLSPVDRIFTRLGASDRITAGQSTFCVELTETNVILREATRHSLVILDELGRGTSTHDGTAIAFAVLKDLAERVQCRTLFSTHYHSLVDDFKGMPAIHAKHMACMVENENEEDPTEETITFLYKLLEGPCPKSYGFHAAKLAGIPLEVIRKAHTKSGELDKGKPGELAKELKALAESASDAEIFGLVKKMMRI